MCLSAQLGPERQCIYRCITKRNTTVSHSTAVHTWEHTQNPQIILLAYAILRRAKPPPGSPVVCTQASRWKACVSEYTDVSSLYNLNQSTGSNNKNNNREKTVYQKPNLQKYNTFLSGPTSNSLWKFSIPLCQAHRCVSMRVCQHSPQAQYVFVFSSNPARCWLFWVGGVWC